MVLKEGIRKGLAALLLLAAGGCVWVDGDAPAKVYHPIDHPRTLVVPDTVDTLFGVTLPSTSELTDFLGTGEFRIAFSLKTAYAELAQIYVVEPGLTGGPLRILRYSQGDQEFVKGDALKRGWTRQAPTCRLSRDGNHLVYLFHHVLPIMWYQNLIPGRTWRLALGSSENRSLGILGLYPFWHSEGGRERILFTQIRHGRTPDGLGQPLPGLLAERTLAVQLESDSVLSPVAPADPGTTAPTTMLREVSRDGRWAIIGDGYNASHLLPRERLSDTARLRQRGDLYTMAIARGASLNPFDSSESPHTDYHAVRRYHAYGLDGELDSAASPKHLDGRFADLVPSGTSDVIWICDRNHRIVFSQPVGRTGGEYKDFVRWTSHPNFLVSTNSGDIHLVKIGATADVILKNTEESTLSAAGVLRLATVSRFGHPEDPDFQDVSVWVGR